LTTLVGQSETFTLQIGQSIVKNGGFETGDFTGWTMVGNTIVGRGRFATTADSSGFGDGVAQPL